MHSTNGPRPQRAAYPLWQAFWQPSAPQHSVTRKVIAYRQHFDVTAPTMPPRQHEEIRAGGGISINQHGSPSGRNFISYFSSQQIKTLAN